MDRPHAAEQGQQPAAPHTAAPGGRSGWVVDGPNQEGHKLAVVAAESSLP